MSKRIIAIEDDAQIAELIALLLQSEEVKIEHYSEGPSGLAAVLENPPDLVLLDIMIPLMNGWDVHQKIREHEPTRQLPIIILSVTQQPFERRVDFVRSGRDFYISKPFDILALRMKVKELLNVSGFQVKDEMPAPVHKTDASRPLSIASKLLDSDETHPTRPKRFGNSS